MVRTDRLFVLRVAKVICLFRNVHQEVHAKIADESFGLGVNARLRGQFLHDELLDGGCNTISVVSQRSSVTNSSNRGVNTPN